MIRHRFLLLSVSWWNREPGSWRARQSAVAWSTPYRKIFAKLWRQTTPCWRNGKPLPHWPATRTNRQGLTVCWSHAGMANPALIACRQAPASDKHYPHHRNWLGDTPYHFLKARENALTSEKPNKNAICVTVIPGVRRWRSTSVLRVFSSSCFQLNPSPARRR